MNRIKSQISFCPRGAGIRDEFHLTVLSLKYLSLAVFSFEMNYFTLAQQGGRVKWCKINCLPQK